MKARSGWRGRCAIYIKSYPGDYEWLQYCLQSINKFVSGHNEVVLAIPREAEEPFHNSNVRVVRVAEKGNGYYWQMYQKLVAYRHVNAKYIIYVDSDCVFTMPFNVGELFDEDGKLKILAGDWANSGEGICWKDPADKALGWSTKYDTMKRHPMAYHRSTLKSLKKHIEKTHNKKLSQYVLSEDRFIEFVTAGNFALQTQSHLYARVDNDRDYPNPILQSWSWGGLSPEIRRQLQEIVS
jgi:hypothetical protein